MNNLNNKKKLGICICYQFKNYGSQLQSYATTVELKRRNIDFEIIRYKKKFTPKLIISLIPRLFNPVFISERFFLRYRKKIILKLNRKLNENNNRRNACLAKFSDERFKNLSPVYYGYDELCKASKNYDGVLVGSDQLWSPSGITSNFYNLMFVDDNILKISYASSIGVSNIKKKLHDVYSTFLSRIDYVSVRENTAKKLVEELSTNTAEVVVDPVLLLSGDDWLNEIPDKKLCDEPYIYAYFLGKTPEYRQAVTKFAKEKGLKIVTTHHMDTYNKADVGFGDYAPYDVGPQEFINFIRNAEYVFTDSFHGCVFSMLYKKQFMVFKRYSDKSISSKNSRIESFCENYDLHSRCYNGDINAVDNEIDYAHVLDKVEQHRQKSLAFLDKALKDFK